MSGVSGRVKRVTVCVTLTEKEMMPVSDIVRVPTSRQKVSGRIVPKDDLFIRLAHAPIIALGNLHGGVDGVILSITKEVRLIVL